MMNNLQSSALVAKNLLNVLQGYTKGIRFLLVMFLTLTVSVEVWSANASHTCSNTSGTIVSSKITFTTTSATWNSPQCRIAANGSITFTLTGVSVTKIAMGFSSSGYVGSWTSSGGGSFSTNSTTVTWTGSANPGTLTFTTSSAARLKTISVTYETATSYTVNWTINPTEGGDLSSTSGSSITVTPDAAYTYASPAYEVTSGSATVSQSGNTFTATPTENSAIQINMVEKPKYTVNWYVNGTKEHSQTGVAGTALTDIPVPTTLDCDGEREFVGWTTQSSYEHATNAPTGMITSTTGMTIPENGEDYYAVFAKETTTTGGTTTTTFTAGTDNIATGKNGIKFTMSNTTGSGGYYQVYSGSAMTINSDNPITSFVITCTASGTTKYGPGNITFKTGSYSYSGTNGTWTGNSTSIQSENSTAQLRITQIVVTTSGGTTTTYSDYTTSCITETVVTLDPNGGAIDGDSNIQEIQTENGTLTLPTPTRVGYTFTGWNTEKNGSGDTFDAGEITEWNASIKTLYAQWCATLSAPTGLNATPTKDGATIYWQKVMGASGYEISINDGNWIPVDAGDNPSYNVTGIECGGTTVTYVVRAVGDTEYCDYSPSSEKGSFKTSLCDCPNTYSFHYKNDGNWIANTVICFSPVEGATNNYLTDELYLPYSQFYKVAWQGQDQSYSVETEYSGNMPFYHNRDKKFGANPQHGNLGGGKGKFHVYHDSGDNNKYISFIPTGYTLNFGSGDEWNNDQTLYFTPKTSNWDEKEWYTDLVTLTNDQINKQIFVGLQTEVDYVWCEPYSEKLNITGMRTKKGSGENWVDGGMNTSYTNKTGKFRIYADSGDKNWYVTFVPHYQLKYDANGGTGTMNPMPAEPVSCEDTETNRTFKVAANTFTRDNYNFTGWNTKADGTGQAYAVNNDIVLTGDVTLYAQWEQQSCPAYSFHTGGSDVWNTREEDHCFVQKGSTSEWRIDNYIRPNHTHYVVNWQGGKHTNGGSQNATFASRSWDNMPFANVRSATVGQSSYGVKGSLRIYDDSSQENLYISFIPDAYVLKFGTTEYAITQHSGNDYRSEIVEYAASASANYSVSVGVADADGHYVATNHTQEMRHIFLDVSKQLNNGKWTDASAKFAIYYWNSSTNGWSSFMKAVPGETNLYEAWIPSSYTNLKFVRLNSNAGTPNWDSKWNETGNLTITTSNNLFTITDWGAGTWSAYSSKGKFRMHDDSGDKNWYVHFYPHYVLTYNRNHADATGSMEQQSVPKDASSKAITIAECGFARIGYDFVAWNANMNGQGTSYNPGDTYTLNADKTLYAKWAPQQYEIIYKDQGNVAFSGENTTSLPAIHTYGTATAIPDGVKTGYTFGGWYDNPDCTGTPINQLGATDYTSDITLYAKWTANTNTAYTVKHYQENIDGTYPATPTNTDNLTGTTATSVTPAVKDYTGFTAPSTQTVTIAADGSTVVEYKYIRNSYTLAWDLAGGRITQAGTTAGPVKFDAPLTAPTVTKSGLTFIDWNPEVPPTMPAADTTYTAIWENCIWVETTTIEDGDEIVFIMVDKTTSTSYAMNNEVTPSSNPRAIEINTDIFLSSYVPNNIIWDIQKDVNGIVFYSKTAAESYLRCNAKPNVRVGVGANNTFTLDNGYIRSLSYDDSYLAVATGATTKDWRQYGYSSGNITNQTLKLYKRVCLPEGQYWVKWMVNGQEYTEGDPTTMVTDGQIKAIPTNPVNEAIGDCADTFIGWSESNLGSAEGQDAPTDLFTTLDEAQELTITENKTFHAVFATKGIGGIAQGTVLWAENFAHFGTNTPSTAKTGTGTTIYGDASITYSQTSDNTKGYNEEIAGGTKPELLLYKGGSHTWTIAGIPTGGAAKMTLSFLSNRTDFNVTSSTTGITINGSETAWNIEADSDVTNFTLTIKNTSDKNARLDNVSVVVAEGGVSYSNYVTNCCNTPAPTNGAYTSVSGTEIKLTWDDAANTNYYHITGGNLSAEGVYSNNKYCNITGLTECEEYTFNVAAYPEGGCESAAIAIIAQPYSGAKTVTFNPNGGAVSPTSFTTSCDKESTTLPTPTYSGYRFMGWFTAESGGTEIDDNPYTPTEDITLFAHWEKEYTVTYDLQGGTASPVCSGDKYIAGEIVTICTSTPIKSGYKFTGWTYSPDVTITNGQFTMPASNVTITAEFVARAVTNIEVATNTHRVLMQGSTFIGEQIRVTYDNGETELLEWNNSKLTFTGHNTNELGVQTVTVTYTGEGTAHTQYNIEVIDGLGITFWDGNYTEVVKYEPGDLVDVDSRIGQNICSGWEFVGWSETKVANESEEYVPVHNFNATDAKVLYAVYANRSDTWITALNITEMHSGAEYIIVKNYSPGNDYVLISTNNTNASYLDGEKLTTSCEKVTDSSNNNRYKLVVTPESAWKWKLKKINDTWTFQHVNSGKYLKINSDNSISLTVDVEDSFTLDNGYNDSEISAQSTSEKFLSWYNGGKYWNGHTSGQQYYLTNVNSFTSTPPCSPLSATFYGNGGIVTDGIKSRDYLTIDEPTRDAGITTPTAYFKDCNGKSWTFVGWSREEIDVTRVPVLTTDLLHDGGGNKHYYIQEDGEEFWAVYTNQGTPETKYGTITFEPNDFPNTYINTVHTITKTVNGDDYVFEHPSVASPTNQGIQLEEGKGYIKNITSLGKINSVSFSNFIYGSVNNLKVTVGKTADDINIELTEDDLQEINGVYTYYPKANYSFVKIASIAGASVSIETISIDFGKGTQIWATTPDCSTITLSGDNVYVTSTNGQSIRAAAQLTVRARQLPTNLVLTSNNSDVYFSTEKDANFTKAVAKQPKQLLTLDVDGDGNLDNTTIYVHYKPSSEGNGISEEVVVSANLETPKPAISDEQTIHVRDLPADFVIAAKWGDNWYAMPANMDSQSSTEGWLIEVDDPSDPTKALAAPNTTKYGLKSVYASNSTADRYADNGERLVFVENVTEATPITNKTLYNGGDGSSSKTNIQVYAQYANYYSDQNQAPRYEWIPTTTDLTDYTLTSGAILTGDAVGRTVSLDNHGIFGTLLQDKSYNGMVRLLPVDYFYGPAELQVVEWKQNSVSVMYTGAGTKYTTKVGNNAESSVQALPAIDHAVYSLSTSDLTSATNQPLIITIKDNANATIGSIKLTIPAIVATDKSSTALGVAEENAKATSIVVLSGATLTADDTKYTYDDITVYPDGKLVIGQSGRLGMYTLTLRAGSSWGAAEYENKYPQLLVRGDYSNTSGQINLDYVTTQDYYYPLSVPEQVTIDDIKYPVEIYGSNVEKANKGSFQLKYYDGAQRVAQGSQYGTGWIVVDENTTTTLTPNQGYAIWGIPKKVSVNGATSVRQKYGIHRIPIKKAAGDLAMNEKTNAEIPIKAHGINDANVLPNDKGWNYLGNPYLAQLGGMDGTDDDLQMGLLVQEVVNGQWTGGWVNNGAQVRYVTLTNDCQTFEAKPVAEAQIPAFTTFFIQAAQDGAILLTAPKNAEPASIAARRYAAQQETAKEITTGIILTGNDQTDRTGLLIADNFTEEYDFNADLSKFENSGINLYTIGKTGNLAYMAINQALAEQPIPVGYSAPAEGLYTIAFDEDRYNATDISALYLIDYDSNEKTNLLHTDYSFVTAAGTNNQRFALQVAFAPENATNVEWVGDATIQVGVEGNELILHNLPTDAAVHVYDALGRLMYHTPHAPTEMQLTLPTGYYLVRIADKQHAAVINTVIP